MEQNNSKIFNKEIMQAVSAFCSTNNLEDIDDFMYRCFKKGFDIEKYGLLGKTGGEQEKRVEIEVIREIRVEVPVEVEKIVEVIKEVPVEKVVTKIEYISDNNKLDEMEKSFQDTIAKKDEELDKLRRNLDELRHNLDIPVTNDKVNMLQETLQKLRGELQEKNLQINNLQKINNDLQGMVSNRQGTYLRSSNLRDRL
jgi:hypothetical protein